MAPLEMLLVSQKVLYNHFNLKKKNSWLVSNVKIWVAFWWVPRVFYENGMSVKN